MAFSASDVSVLQQGPLPQFLLLQSSIPFVISDGSWVSNWNMQAWTLSVELFFYLTFSFLLAIFLRLSTSAIGGALAAVVAIIMGLRGSSAADGPLVLFAWMRMFPGLSFACRSSSMAYCWARCFFVAEYHAHHG